MNTAKRLSIPGVPGLVALASASAAVTCRPMAAQPTPQQGFGPAENRPVAANPAAADTTDNGDNQPRRVAKTAKGGGNNDDQSEERIWQKAGVSFTSQRHLT